MEGYRRKLLLTGQNSISRQYLPLLVVDHIATVMPMNPCTLNLCRSYGSNVAHTVETKVLHKTIPISRNTISVVFLNVCIVFHLCLKHKIIELIILQNNETQSFGIWSRPTIQGRPLLKYSKCFV